MRALGAVLAAAVLVWVGANAQTASEAPGPEPITVTVDGSALEFADVQPAEEAGRVFLPLRPVAERLGIGELRWDAQTQSVSFTRGGREYHLRVGRPWATSGRTAIPLDAAPILCRGRMLVPLGVVRDVLGASAAWDPKERKVAITTAPPGDK